MNSMLTALRSPLTWLALAWSLSAAIVVASLIAGLPAMLVVGIAVNAAADLLMYRWAPALARWLGSRQISSAVRSAFRQSTALLGWVVFVAPGVGYVLVGSVTAVGVLLAHFVFRTVSARNQFRRTGRYRWANLDVNGERTGPERLPSTMPRVAGVGGSRLVLHFDLVLLAGVLLAALTGAGVIIGTAVAVGALAAWALWRVAARNRLIQRLPTADVVNADVVTALGCLEAEVVVYFSGPRGTTYQLNVWLETIDRLDRPAFVVLRESHHLDRLLPCSTPVVAIAGAQDLQSVQFDSLLVALYPTTVINNNHMLRVASIKHVFINHGDGDKAVTYSPLHRVFDEIWVAGQAARDRYLHRGEGVRAEQIRTVGRPQLRAIERPSGAADDSRPVTVLYAPTWEGNFDEANYSSIAAMGEAIVEKLSGLDPPVRILFKPHPATGVRLPTAARALRRIETRLRASPYGEIVSSEPSALYEAFNACDVLISDVSSVVADFLASRKPYLMTNPMALVEHELHADYPSTRGGGLIARDASNVADLVLEAVGPDVHATQRHQLADYFLGSAEDDPIEPFVTEVRRACADQAESRSTASPNGTTTGSPS